MKKWLLILPILFSGTAFSQIAAITNYCVLGGIQTVTSGLHSSNYQQGIIPSCTVTVYSTGTTTLATIYADTSETPLSNPFTATSKGAWLFFAAANQGYDVVLSGGISPNTYPSSLTMTGLYPQSQIAGAVWGQIAGILSNQTDLQTALNAKLSLTGGTMTGNLILPGITITGLTGYLYANSSSAVTASTTIPIAALSYDFTTVNGQICTLGSSCTITATGADIVVGTTTVSNGTSGYILYDNAGVLGNLVTTGSGSAVLATSPFISNLTVYSSFTATGLVTNADLVNTSTTVNGQTCTLGGSCTVTAAATGITVGTTTVSSGTTGYILYDNSGLLGNLATTGSGNVVEATSPSISDLTVTSSFTATGLVTNAALVNTSTTVNSQTCTLGGSCTVTAASSSITVGTTSVSNGTTGYILYDNAGVLGNLATTGSGNVVEATSPSISNLTVTSSFTATGLVTNADLVNTSTTVNSQTCTLGGSCTVTAVSASITVGTTSVSNGTTGYILYDNAGVLGNLATTGSGNVVKATSPSISNLTVTSSFTATGLVTNADLVNTSTTVNSQTCTLGSSCTITTNTPNSLTFNNGGSGGASGSTFNGASALTVSYNTVGAAASNASITVNGVTCTLGSSCSVTAASSKYQYTFSGSQSLGAVGSGSNCTTIETSTTTAISSPVVVASWGSLAGVSLEVLITAGVDNSGIVVLDFCNVLSGATTIPSGVPVNYAIF
jgi:hypothetical protein